MTEQVKLEVKEMSGTHKTKTLVRARRRSSRGMATRPPRISVEQAKSMTRALYDGYMPHH